MTPRKQAFVAHLLTCHNATEASRRAGTVRKTARAQGSRLLTDVDVRAAVAAGRQQAHDQAGITAERIARELGRLAFANISDIVSWDAEGRLTIKASADVSPEVLAAIAEVTETVGKNGRTLRVKMHSKTTAIELLTHQRLDEELDRRLTEIEARLSRMGKYEQLQGRNGHGEPSGYRVTAEED